MSWTASDPSATAEIAHVSQVVGNDRGFLLAGLRASEVGTDVWYSADGLTWSALDRSTFGASNSLVTLAAGDNGFWVTASDPITPGATAPAAPTPPTGPPAPSGLFGSGTRRLYHSPDGRSWTMVVQGPDAPQYVGTAGGFLFSSTPEASGRAQVMRSTDGITWEPTSFPGGGNFHPRELGVAEGHGHFLLPAAHDYDGGVDYFESTDGLTWRQLPSQPGSGSNAITARGVVRAYVPYPPTCSPPGEPCLAEVRVATLAWGATEWETTDVIGATIQTPGLYEIGADLILVLVDESGAVTVSGSLDGLQWTTRPEAAVTVAHDTGVSAVANSTSIVIAELGASASFIVGRIQLG